MKNKHLLLLFVAVLLLGWISRWIPIGMSKAPLRLFRTGLMEADALRFLSSDTILLYRVDSSWIQQSNGLLDEPVLDSAVSQFLTVLSNLEAIVLLKTDQPDSIGLAGESIPTILLSSSNFPRMERIRVGKSYDAGAEKLTWIRLNDHPQCYLVNADLHSFFTKNWKRLPSTLQLQLDTTSLTNLQLIRNGDTLEYQLSTEDLEGVFPSKRGIKALFKQAVPATMVDPSGHRETIWGELLFKHHDSLIPPLRFRLFYLNRPELPDDPDKRRYFRPINAQFLVESAAQPGLYFSITDTLAINRLFYVHKKEKK